MVAVYHNQTDADEAVKGLRSAALDARLLSIAVKGYQAGEQLAEGQGDRRKYRRGIRALLGGLCGLLFGSVVFASSGGTALVGTLVASSLGAMKAVFVVGGLGVLGACLTSAGLRNPVTGKDEEAVKNDKFFVFVNGTAAELFQARQILQGPEQAEPLYQHRETKRVSTSF